MSHAGKVCAHSWRSLFLFPYMPTLPLRLYKLFSEYFLEHAAIIFLYKNIKNKKFFFIHAVSSSDRSKILQHDEIMFKCNAQWSICGRNTQHEIPTGHTLLRCHSQGQFCHFRFHVATALEIYSNISSLWSPGNCLLQHVIRTKPICSLRVSAAIFLLRKKSRLPTYQKLLW